ncbi:MAG TPA: hypothetical protein VHG28_18755 [Longimicrobiaceae bacterium]|nr:hypothetical protein [Longimicrobiaceae bacterium]
MNGYQAWNLALRNYLTAGVARGRPVFLHVDASVLSEIARTLPEPLTPAEAEDAFCAAVRGFVTVRGVVDTELIRRIDVEHDVPLCLAFLAATVLAATRMREGEDVSESNYFVRLREVLGMPAGPGRPPGMEAGWAAELPLWRLWNRWLQKNGWLPTASAGEGPHTYIHFPISQALLRAADTDRLVRIFTLRQWRQDFDPATIVAALSQSAGGLSAHLRELLGRDDESREAVSEAVHELYESWRTSGAESMGSVGGLRVRAGLIRSEDPWSGGVCYCFYPRAARQARGGGFVVDTPEGPHPLREERPGWYEPFGEVTSELLSSGARLSIRGGSVEGELILPARRFWILVPDPEDPESGAYATWGVPRVGDPFVLLLQEALLADVEILREEGLFRYADGPRPRGDGWLELVRCEPLVEAWGEVFVGDTELKEALRPITPLGLRLSGGLRAPGGLGWLDEAGPAVEVSGFAGEVDLRVVAVGAEDEREILAEPLGTGARRLIPWPGPGDYRVEATVGAWRARRLVKIAAWEALTRCVPDEGVATELHAARVVGARVMPRAPAKEHPG